MPQRRKTGSSSRSTRSRNESPIDIHRGEALWSFAHTYPSLPLCLIEAMQNGIDNEATAIFVGVDLRGGNRNVVIADNGLGTDRHKFETALGSVGKTVKDSEKLGKFGRGLVSPLDKCTSFTFTSQPAGRRSALQWVFRGEEIREQHFQLNIPCKSLRALPPIGKQFDDYLDGEFVTEWRTMVRLNGVTKDKVISLVDLDDLEGQVRTKLGPAMRKNNVVIRVVLIDADGRVQNRDINPIAFTGQQLPIIKYIDPDAGEVVFELYRAQKLGGQRKGTVSVMELAGSYPISMREFATQARGRKWSEALGPVFAALSSGYFEGIIKCKNIQLHAERTKFEYDEALMGLYVVMDTWYEEHGSNHYENEQEDSREERYQQLGLKSANHINDLLHRPEFSTLRDVLKSVVSFGRLGQGHLDPSKGQPDGIEDDSSIRSGQGGAGKKRTKRDPKEPSGESSTREPKDRPGDTPIGATGPRGNRRQLVKGDSQGLWFEYSTLSGSMHLWEFDFERGVLTFNVRHPIWEKLDETGGKHLKKNERQILHLQEWLALQVLHLLVNFSSPVDFDQHRAFVDGQIKHYVEMFILRSPSK